MFHDPVMLSGIANENMSGFPANTGGFGADFNQTSPRFSQMSVDMEDNS